MKQTNQRLVEKLKAAEQQLTSLQEQHCHLVAISRNQQLGERETLTNQVMDLQHALEQQNNTIQVTSAKPCHSPTVWCGVVSFGGTELYFFEENGVTVNLERYVCMLNNFFTSELWKENKYLNRASWTRWCYSTHRTCINDSCEKFVSLGLLLFLGRYSHLSSCNLFFWGYLKQQVLKTTLGFCKRIDVCNRVNGQHLEIIFCWWQFLPKIDYFSLNVCSILEMWLYIFVANSSI